MGGTYSTTTMLGDRSILCCSAFSHTYFFAAGLFIIQNYSLCRVILIHKNGPHNFELSEFGCFFGLKTSKWPASRQKRPSDETKGLDLEQPLHDIENSYT